MSRSGEIIIKTYKPHSLDISNVEIPPSLSPLLEKLAENAHEVWAAQRIADGWTYGAKRDDGDKKHPCLVPYDQLPESEKEYDRKTSAESLKAILTMGYRIEKIR